VSFLGNFGAVTRGLGSAGEQLGAASEGLRKSKLEELLDNIRLQQLRLQIQKQQNEMHQANLPQPAGIIGGPGGSQEGLTFDPVTGQYKRQTIIPGYDPASLSKQSDSLIGSLPESIRPIAKGVYDS
jgi:hypothetical protein